ncbi:MAG: YqaJ viral recombinase family protein [Steroidobacteraceae bacterium]
MSAAIDEVVSGAVREDRKEGLGASDAPSAVGLSPWKTQYQLFREKLGLPSSGTSEEELREKLHIQMGEALEPVALAQFCKKSRLQVSERQRKIVDPAWSRRWVRVDALSSDGGYVEAKSTGFADPDEWGDENEDGAIPMHYLIQAQHGLACGGFAHAWVPLIISNRQFRLYRVKRDEELIQLLTERERAFWQLVEAKEPPAPTNLEDVKLRWPSHKHGEFKRATSEIDAAMHRHAQVRDQIKTLAGEKEQLELAVKTYLADCSELVAVEGAGLICTWRQAKASQVFNEDKFALEHPDLYRTYLTERPGSRRFLNKV